MENQKLLSIVVPTLNRRELLHETLKRLSVEIAGYESQVEFIVVNNASDDDTLEFLDTWRKSLGFRVESFDQRADIDSSFRRCVEASSGRYINIFGDDDIPMPGFIQHAVKILGSEISPALVYFNRLIGDERLQHVSEIAHTDRGVEDASFDAATFIREFNHNPGFVSSLVFDREIWENGEPFYSDDFLGYKFLARVYGGIQGRKCTYVGMPSLIQRRGVQSWKKDWPRYWLVNMPRMLGALEEAGITSGAVERWRSKEVSLKRLIVDCMVAKAYGYRISDSFWSLAIHHQNFQRAFLIQLIRLMLPHLLARFLYFRHGKYRAGS